MVKSEAGGHFTRHTSLGLSGSRAATSGERGALGSDVSRLWCSIHQHVTSRHARVCHRAGTQTNQHKPLGHVTSRSLKRMSVRHRVESGAPFNTGRDLREDIVIERGGLRDASASDFQQYIYSSTSPTWTPKRGSTCGSEVLTNMDWLFPLLRRESATTTPVLDMCPSTSAAINLSPLGWKALGVSDGKERIHRSAGDECGRRMGWEGAMPRKASTRNAFFRYSQ